MTRDPAEPGDVAALREQLTPGELLYLEAIEHLTDRPRLAVTSEIAQYVYDHSPPPKTRITSAPWHGTRDVITSLRDRGLVRVHHGMARFTPPGGETRSPENIAVSLTESGSAVISTGL